MTRMDERHFNLESSEIKNEKAVREKDQKVYCKEINKANYKGNTKMVSNFHQ